MKKLIYFMIIPVILLTSGMLSGCGSSKKSTDGGLVNVYNINLASLEISAGALTPAFDQTVTGYSAEVANNIPSITATPESADPKAAITVNGTAVASGSASSSIALAAGTDLAPCRLVIFLAAPAAAAKIRSACAAVQAATGRQIHVGYARFHHKLLATAAD